MRECNSYYPSVSLLEQCTSLRSLKAIHGVMVTLGLVRYTYITSRILAYCATQFAGSSDMDYARHLFDRIPQPTIFNWNTMIRGYSMTSSPERGLSVYRTMRRRDVAPNMHTFPFVAKAACARLPSLSQIHAQILKFGLGLDVYVTSSLIKAYSDTRHIDLASQVFDESPNRNTVCWTSLITGYCGMGLVDKAREVFERMPEKNDVSWSAMITGYVRNERHKEAIELFGNLRACLSARPNASLLVSVLRACSSSGNSEEGLKIHDYIDKERIGYGLELGTALVDCYMKSGLVERAKEVFDKMPRKDVMAWSAMIMGLALNGKSQSAVDLFAEMLRSRIMPNSVTFIGVLTACNHGGLVDQGQEIFEDMIKIYSISPSLEHYSCMVDLLSRAGQTAKAERLIHSMPMEPDGAIWGALLNGCMMHGHLEIGEMAGRYLTKLEPEHCGRYVALANMYAATGKWDRVLKVRRDMWERGVEITTGWSLIQVDGIDHQFQANHKMHTQMEEIYRMLGELYL